jgi:hypothetical protein
MSVGMKRNRRWIQINADKEKLIIKIESEENFPAA